MHVCMYYIHIFLKADLGQLDLSNQPKSLCLFDCLGLILLSIGRVGMA